ncbi:MAG TPA: hypothetical protein VN641_08625 [Urbifossiella sp.]|nr:hypothetical protein [Urbifossiella sp.]
MHELPGDLAEALQIAKTAALTADIVIGLCRRNAFRQKLNDCYIRHFHKIESLFPRIELVSTDLILASHPNESFDYPSAHHAAMAIVQQILLVAAGPEINGATSRVQQFVRGGGFVNAPSGIKVAAA